MVTPNPMTCAETLDRLDDYVDRELAPQELADIEAHLDACARCAGEFEVERDVLEAIRAKLRQLRVPDGLLKRISDRLRAR